MSQQKSRTVNTAKNLSVGILTQVLSLVLSFVTRTVFVWTLGNEYLSVNGLFTNILTLLTFTDLGIGSAIIFSLYKPLADDDKAKIGQLINLFKVVYRYIALAILVLGILVIPFLTYIVNDIPNVQEDIRFLYILFLLNTVASYVYGYKNSLFIADQKNYVVITIHTVLNVLLVGAQVLILFFTHNFVLYLVALIAITLLNNIISTRYANRKYSWIAEYEHLKLDKKERYAIFTNIKNIVIYKFGSVILNGTDNIIISALIKTTLVGICSNYSMLINAVHTIINQGVAGISASIGNFNVNASKEDNENVFNQLFLLSFWAIGLVSLLMFCTFSSFVKLWLGDEYVLENYVVVIMVLGFYTLMINTIPSSYRTAMGYFKEARFAPFYAAIINVVLSIVGAKLYGLVGVFAATIFARLFTYCIIDPYYVYTKGFESSPVKYYWRFCFRTSLLMIIYFVCQSIIIMINIEGIFGLLVDFCICLIIFNVAFVSIYWRNPDLQQAFSKIKHNLIRR